MRSRGRVGVAAGVGMSAGAGSGRLIARLQGGLRQPSLPFAPRHASGVEVQHLRVGIAAGAGGP
jgi:hypothetical protein